VPNLELVRKDDVSSFRKIAIGTWRTAYDPSVYGTIELRMDDAVRYIAAFREKTGKKLTISHMMAKAAAMVLKECPDANAILRFNKIYLRKRITISTLVVQTDGGKVDLTSAKIDDAEQKTLREISAELEAAGRAAATLGGGPPAVHPIDGIPELSGHVLVTVPKRAATPAGFPRDPARRSRQPW